MFQSAFQEPIMQKKELAKNWPILFFFLGNEKVKKN
jgi:hypothetical protein